MADEGVIDAARWQELQRQLPIICVDVLPYVWMDREAPHAHRNLMLIARDVPAEGGGWGPGLALIGGRVRYREPLDVAIARHIDETLAGAWPDVPIDVHGPDSVGQYFPEHRVGMSFDPRQHSVALSYLVELAEEISPEPRGEAREVEWVPEFELRRSQVGFDQWLVIERMLGHELGR